MNKELRKWKRIEKFKKFNDAEKNSILYYADFLSLKKCSKTVTDNCKYYFIHGLPINCAYMVGLEPEYDLQNKFIHLAITEYTQIRNKFGQEGIDSFIGDLGMLRARGCIDAISLLLQIHLYSTKSERKFAFKEYFRLIRELMYEHEIKDEDGNTKKVPCTRYISHLEKRRKRQRIPKNLGYAMPKLEENIE